MAAFGSDSISLLFRMTGDSSSARDASAKLKAQITSDVADIESKGKTGFASLAQSMGMSEGAATKLAGAMPIVSAAALGIASAVGAAALGLFALAKSSSDYGSEIFDASQKTGLAAETLSAMKFAADQSGTSLEAITAASAKFARVIDEAGNGSEKAQAKLARLGVTSKDLDTALGQALETIVKMPPGVEQMTAAQDAFGKSGADLLPFIKSFDGDLVGLIRRAKELGVTLTDEDAKAADDFGDTLDTLSAQAAGVGRIFVGPMMRDITQAMGNISTSLSANKTAVKDWGESVATTLRGLKNISTEIYNFMNTPQGAALSMLLFGGWIGANKVIQGFAGQPEPAGGAPIPNLIPGRDPYNPQPKQGPTSYDPAQPRKTSTRSNWTPSRDTSEQDMERARREEERRQEEAERRRVEQARQSYEQQTRWFEAEANKRYAVSAEFAEKENRNADKMAQFAEFLEDAKLEYRKGKLEIYFKQLVAGTDEYIRVEEELKILEFKIEQTRAENATNEEKRRKKGISDLKEQFDLEVERFRLIAAARAAQQEAELQENLNPKSDIVPIPDESLWDTTQITAQNAAIDTLRSSFSALGQAIGQVVQAWVLYGSVGGSVRKVTAQILASIAQQAAIQAVFQLAEGFAKLAMAFFGHPMAGASATQHFIAAGVYASIAGVAAIAGRTVAGNSFQQQSGTATGTSSGRNSAQGTAGERGAYSGQENITVENSRNTPGNMGVLGQLNLKIIPSDQYTVEIVKEDIRNNGPLRLAIQDATE